MRRSLVIPGQLAGIHVHRDQSGREQIVTLASTGGVSRSRVTRSENVEMRFRIVRTGDPGHAAAVARGIQAGPSLGSGITGLLRRRIESPLECARFGVEGFDVSRGI